MLNKTNPVNTKKIIIFPILIFILLITISGYIFNALLINSYEKDLITDSSTLAEMLSDEISLSYQIRDQIIEEIDCKNMSTAKLIITNKDNLSNSYLKEILEIMHVDDIWYYNSNGVVIFDAREEYIGWVAKEGDPIYNFMTSGSNLLVEEIRQETDSQDYLKCVYIRADDGSFVQVATSLGTILDKIATYENQTIIDNYIEKHSELLYSLVVDTDYISIANSDSDKVGIDYSDREYYIEVLNGNTAGSKLYYDRLEETVYEIATPIYYDDEIIGLVGIGVSLSELEFYKASLLQTLFIFGTGLISIIIILPIFLISRPLKRLNDFILNGKVDLQAEKNVRNPFYGLYKTFNEYIKTINRKTEKIQSSLEKSQYISNHDYLTGLYNRRGFFAEIENWEEQSLKFVILFLDLDKFKYYNDLKGHAFGDRLLIEFTKHLKQIHHDKFIVGRYGGDEFLVAFRIASNKDVTKCIQLMKNAFDKYIVIDEFKCQLSASIGASVFPHDGDNIETIIDNAEMAMQIAKKSITKKAVLYTKNIKQEKLYSSEIVESLKNCIENDEFEILYQPQYNINTNTIISLEALLRIKNRKLSPSVFIPIAEKNGLMEKIGKIVIEKVINQVSLWKKKKYKVVPVYINFSETQLYDKGISKYIEVLLNKYSVEPNLIGVEVTEEVFIDRENLVIDSLKELKKVGVNTAIDDFGEGNAGINYLTKFEVDFVKIDKSIADKYLNEEKIIIFDTILKLCDTLGFKVIAEGIETRKQIDLLKNLNVTYVQGFYYSKPLSVQKIEMKLEKQEE